MRQVDAGVQYRDVDTLAGVAAAPDLRGADLRRTVGEVGLELAVQPDLGDPAGEGGRAVERAGVAGAR